MDVSVRADGLKEFRRDVRRADKEVGKELQREFRDIARKVASEAASLAPRRTGELAGGYRGIAVGAKAIVRNRVFYSRFVEFGFHPGGGDAMVPGVNPIGQAVERQEDSIVDALGDAVDRASGRLGWH